MRSEPRSDDAPAGPRARNSLGAENGNLPVFNTVVVDLETLIPEIECFAWLAVRRGEIVQRRVAELADEAQRGTLTTTALYRERLALIRPRRADLDALAAAYVAKLPPTAADVVRRLKRRGVRVVLVSAGLRYALLRVAARLELDLADIHGVDVRFDALGAFTGFDAASPLGGAKIADALIARLDIEPPVITPRSFAHFAALA